MKRGNMIEQTTSRYRVNDNTQGGTCWVILEEEIGWGKLATHIYLVGNDPLPLLPTCLETFQKLHPF